MTIPKEPALIGIFGTGRNGSTLLARLLDGIPNAYVHAVEANFLSAIDSLYTRELVAEDVIKNATTRPLRWLDRDVSSDRLLRYYDFHRHEIMIDLLSEVTAPGISLGPPPFDLLPVRDRWLAKEFVPAFMQVFAGWLQPTQLLNLAIFKSIETPYIEDYERLFPTMRFIHIVRDPVGMWASQKRSLVVGKKRPPWYLGDDNLTTVIDVRWMPHARLLAARKGDARHFLVRYEDLVRNADDVMAGLLQWLGGDAPKEPTVQTVLGGLHPRKFARFSSQPGVDTPRTVVSDMGKQHKYADVITNRERDLIRLATWSLARDLGYGLDEVRPDPAAVRSAWWRIERDDLGTVRSLRDGIRQVISLVRRRQYVGQVCQQALHE